MPCALRGGTRPPTLFPCALDETIRINHFPLRREHARLPGLIPWFNVIACGTRETETWHRDDRVWVVVSGHLHIRSTRWLDGVRFEEVSLYIPRQHVAGRGWIREPPRDFAGRAGARGGGRGRAMMAGAGAWGPPPAGLGTLVRTRSTRWRAPLAPPPERLAVLASMLRGYQRARAARFVFERDRTNELYIATRGTLRILAGAYLGREPGTLELGYLEKGKPYLASPPGERLRFEVMRRTPAEGACSRSCEGASWAWISSAGASCRICCRSRRRRSPPEFAALCRLPEYERTGAFYACWSRKEAFIKATGEGISQLCDFEVNVRAEEPACLLRVRGRRRRTRAVVDPRFAGYSWGMPRRWWSRARTTESRAGDGASGRARRSRRAERGAAVTMQRDSGDRHEAPGAPLRVPFVGPGRGSYGRAQLGSLRRASAAAGAAGAATTELAGGGAGSLSRGAGASAESELDGRPRTSRASTWRARTPRCLTFACTAADLGGAGLAARRGRGCHGNPMGF